MPIAAWDWPAEPVRYHLESRLSMPQGRRILADRNADTVVRELGVTADVVCTATPDGAHAWRVGCTFVHLRLDGRGADDPVDAVLADWTTTLSTATVAFTQREDGRMGGFDLQHAHANDARASQVREEQREILQRAFAPFDLRLPEAGPEWIRGWSEKALGMAWSLPVGVGTAGVGAIQYTPDRTPDELLEITYGGRMSVAPGANYDEQTGEKRPGDQRFVNDPTWTATVDGSVLFDLAAGLPAWRGSRMEVHRNVALAGTGSDMELLHLAAIQRVEVFSADGSAPAAPRGEGERAP